MRFPGIEAQPARASWLFLIWTVIAATSAMALGVSQEAPTAGAGTIGTGETLYVPPGYDPSVSPSLAFAVPPVESGAAATDDPLQPHFSSRDGKTEAVVSIPPGTSLYGTGEVTGPLLRNGRTITLWNTDNFMYKADGGHRLYQSHPWVLGVKQDGSAFGVLFDTTWKAELTTAADHISLASEGPAFRVAVIERDSPLEVVRALADLIGHMPLPPKWALGFHQCRYSYYPDAKVREIADGFRSRNLPCDAIWMDIHYMDGYRIFTFDPSRFPDPSATNAYLHAKGFHSIWMIDPGVKIDPTYAVYKSGSAINAWVENAAGAPFQGTVWPGPCVFPDFTVPQVRDWWAGLYGSFVAHGVDGVWNDMNEPSVFDSPNHTLPEDSHHRGGGALPAGPHLMYHNVYGMLMTSATRAGVLQAHPDRRPFILTRATYLGGQRYAATWTGDNSSAFSYLQQTVPMSVNLGLSGQPLSGPDIGGYSGAVTPDLYGKWIAMEPFYPFSRAHTEVKNPPREPWVFGPAIEKVARTALDRRYRLLPYLYTLAYYASQRGDPIMQPLYFADPKDVSLREEDQAFLFGPDLMVVPKWANHPKLPKSLWREISLLEDPKAEQDGYQASVRIRGGAIVPLGRIVQNSNEQSLDPLTLVVCLNEQSTAEGTLYEDSGDGFDYTHDGYRLTRYVATQEKGSVVVRVAERKGSYAPAPRQVRVVLITSHGTKTTMGTEAHDIIVPLGS